MWATEMSIASEITDTIETTTASEKGWIHFAPIVASRKARLHSAVPFQKSA
jgi:hypothetical protein